MNRLDRIEQFWIREAAFIQPGVADDMRLLIDVARAAGCLVYWPASTCFDHHDHPDDFCSVCHALRPLLAKDAE